MDCGGLKKPTCLNWALPLDFLGDGQLLPGGDGDATVASRRSDGRVVVVAGGAAVADHVDLMII